MLSSFDFKVFGWFAGYDGCGYYRIVKPLEALKDNPILLDTWDCKVGNLLPGDWPDYDVIVGQRVCTSNGDDGAANVWADEICKDRQIHSVFEIDDDLFNVDPSNPAYEFFSEKATRGNLSYCIAASDLVTVSTEPLREQMLKLNPNVKVLPNFIDGEVLHIPRSDNGDKVVIGWAGSGTHRMDFATMVDELGITLLQNPRARFLTIGADYTHGLPKNQIRKMGWIRTPRKTYPQIAKFDIGLAPLKPHPFNESKSYLKALEYAALGIPCVASKFGPYNDFVDHGVTGFLAEKPGDWRKYLGLLINDPEMRAGMGKAARQKAWEHTIEGNAWRWADAYLG